MHYGASHEQQVQLALRAAGPGSGFLPLVFGAEIVVLIPWQAHCHSLAVELVESMGGWESAAHYFRRGVAAGFGGMCDVWRGPYPSRDAAIRNSVAHLVHHMIGRGLTLREAIRIYRAAGVPVPPRWPNGGDEARRCK